MSNEECTEFYQDGTCKHRDTCDCWCHKEGYDS